MAGSHKGGFDHFYLTETVWKSKKNEKNKNKKSKLSPEKMNLLSKEETW